VFHLFAALGQFERDLIQERTLAGLAAAMARGAQAAASRSSPRTNSGGRGEHIAKGLTVREAATRVKVSKTVLYEARDHEEVCGPRDGVGAGAIWLAGAPTFEATEACRWP